VVRVCETPRTKRSLGHGRIIAMAALLAASPLLSACIPSAITYTEETRPPDVMERVRSLDLLPRSPQPREPNNNPPDLRRPLVDQGGVAVAAAPGPSLQAASTRTGDGFELNFENAPVATVAKVILGDILGTGYTIDARVQGTITLASGRPVPKSDLLFVLENALRMSNVVLVRDRGSYRLMPLGEASASGNIDGDVASAEPGYGISVIPLQHVSAATLIKLLDSFAIKPGSVRADVGRNLLLIQGTGPERRAAIETVLSFDAEWLHGQSVGVFPIRNGTPEAVIAELEKIVDSGENGLTQNMIKFEPISRLNSILVVSRKPDLMKAAATWIMRLDSLDGSNTGVRVYRLRFGDARQMARVLNDLFIGGSSTSLDSASNQIAPGSAASLTSSDQSSGSQFGTGFGGQTASTAQVRQQLGIQPLDRASATQQAATGQGATGFAVGAPDTHGRGGAAVLTGVRITADVANNSLLIYGSQENYRTIEQAIRQMDRPPLQVGIEATVAEVTLNDNLNYGVQFFLTSKSLGLKPDQGSLLNTSATQPPGVSAAGVVGAFISQTFPGFNFLLGPQAQPHIILDALHAVTSVKVLSNPSVVVIDNQPAILQVGDEVPISTGSATVLTTSNTIVNTIDYRNTGIILRVTPRINVNGNIRLDVEQEISNVAPTPGANTLTPTLSQRRVKSSIAVASGQTVLLAGLISERQQRGSDGIPILDQLPDPFNGLFSDRTNQGTQDRADNLHSAADHSRQRRCAFLSPRNCAPSFAERREPRPRSAR
jgi:general secretion pathway protein D